MTRNRRIVSQASVPAVEEMEPTLHEEMEFYRRAWYAACEEFRKLAHRCGVDTTKPPPGGIMTAVEAINMSLARLDGLGDVLGATRQAFYAEKENMSEAAYWRIYAALHPTARAWALAQIPGGTK